MDHKNKEHLYALDGLRGLAILLVFLNHTNPRFIISSFPFLDRIGLFSSGITGVSFLFILSGFFMGYLYPQPGNSWEFLQKRYTRIFPLFLTMCSFMFYFSLFSGLFWYQYLIVLICMTVVSHSVWVYGVQKIQKPLFTRTLFLLFLALQAGIGFLYAFWIMRKPPMYFGQLLPYPIKEALIGLTNATLMFPLGNYIPMLDGLYWSLAAEILFYVLYPFVIVPLIRLLIPKGRSVKILFFVSLIPFFAAVDILSHHIFVLSTLQFNLFYYFATGIVLAYLYKRYKPAMYGISNTFARKKSILICFGLIFTIALIHTFDSVIGRNGSAWIRLLSAIPLTIFVGIALNGTVGLGRFLSNKFFVFLGTISYSIYLSHAIVITIVTSVVPARDIVSNFVGLFLSFIIDIIIAGFLYMLLEKPYFLSSHRKVTTVIKTTHLIITQAKYILIGIMCASIFSIFFAFQSTYNFFSKKINTPIQILLPADTTNSISTASDPHITIQFSANDDHLGIIEMNIAHHKTQKILPFTPMLTFRLTEVKTKKILFSSDYVLEEFRGEDFPFGFPVITNSKNKIYTVDYILQNPSADNYVTLDTGSFKTVYQIQKGDIVKHPVALIHLFMNKFQTIFITPMSKTVFFLFIPFMIISCIVVVLS